jgi:hypothetical protein
MDNPETLATLATQGTGGSFIQQTQEVFYTSGNRFVRRTDMLGNLIFSLVPSDNRNTRSTCPTSVFTKTQHGKLKRGAKQTLPKTGGEPRCLRRAGLDINVCPFVRYQ